MLSTRAILSLLKQAVTVLIETGSLQQQLMKLESKRIRDLEKRVVELEGLVFPQFDMSGYVKKRKAAYLPNDWRCPYCKVDHSHAEVDAFGVVKCSNGHVSL